MTHEDREPRITRMSLLGRLLRSSHIRDEVSQRFLEHLQGGRILDLPAGDGINARNLRDAGFDVVAGDLFPERVQGEGIEARGVNLLRPLPFDDGSFDGVLFSEGIEHLDAQIPPLREMARLLRPGGVLIVTTPNLLNIASRVNTMLTGHAHRHRSPVVSTAQYWSERPADGGDDVYFGHVFLINAFQLRFYLEHVGLTTLGVDTTRYSINSVLLAPLLYLPIWWTTRRLLTGRKAKLSHQERQSHLDQVLSPHVLFGKKLIMLARKPMPDAVT